ncbi:MAG: HlyD family efflux transporter periplasmic adaptor subunit [Planctomycetes bacterium]|nr:HlyD family efflux transporter periplasmic adaptor subunit [Planctomycetota bacterium]
MTQPFSSLDAESVQQAAREIKVIVNEIENLCQQDVGPEEFYREFLPRLVRGLGAAGGAVWMPAGGGALAIAHAIDLDPSFVDNEEHLELVNDAVRHGGPLAVPPGSNVVAELSLVNPTSSLLLFTAVRPNGKVEAMVEIIHQPKPDLQIQRGYLTFLSRMCGLASGWAERRESAQEQSLFVQERQFARLVHQHLDRQRTAYAIANEARRLIECDRVSVAIRKGHRCVIEAISGQEKIEKRSDVVRSRSQLAAKVMATGDALWYDGTNDDLAPQLEAAVGRYVDESFVKTIAVVPLRKTPVTQGDEDDAREQESGPVIGALIIEQIEEERLSQQELESRVNVMLPSSEQALANSATYHALFLLPLWRLLGNVAGLFRGRRLRKTLLVLGILVGAIFYLSLKQADFMLKANGTLEPQNKQEVFAKVPGVVTHVLVKTGDLVDVGETLVELVSPDLEREYVKVQGQLDEAKQTLTNVELKRLRREGDAAELMRLGGEKALLRLRSNSLEAELETLQKQRNELNVKSTMAGKVVTWDVEQRLDGRPVNVGDLLLTVYDPGAGWQLELYMPDKRMGHLNDATRKLKEEDEEKLRVKYILATDPGTDRSGIVEKVELVAQVHGDEGNAVRIQVSIEVDDARHPILNPRPGSTVIGHVHCGRRSLGYVWFHEAGEAIQRFWFSVF